MLNEKQKEILGVALGGKSILLTGAAGVGKSFTLSELTRQLELKGKKYALTAMTGAAAINIGGCTFHSWLGAGLADGVLSQMVGRIFKNKKALARLQNTEVLIIDEVSMMSKDLFETADKILRAVRRRNVPFGGVQVILVGDFLQVPVVSRSSEKFFCFESEIWSELNIQTHILDEIIRQDSEGEFAKILNKIRLGSVDDDVMDVLDTCFSNKFPDDGIEATRIFCINKDVDSYNQQRLNQINQREFSFEAEDSGNSKYFPFFDKNCPAPRTLNLKVGATVMLLKNEDLEAGLCNGSVGSVESISNEYITVRFLNGLQFEVGKHVWDAKEQGFSASGKASMKSVAKRQQFPLRLAYAITVHKSLGCTLDRAEVHLGGVFECGLAYVALSRVRDLESLSIASIDYDRIKANVKCKKFYGY